MNGSIKKKIKFIDLLVVDGRLVAWHSGRTSVSDRRTFAGALDLRLTGDHLCE